MAVVPPWLLDGELSVEKLELWELPISADGRAQLIVRAVLPDADIIRNLPLLRTVFPRPPDAPWTQLDLF